jgi:transketolase
MNAPVTTFDCRQAFADTLIALARADERIVAVCNDSVGSSNLGGFKKEFPDRLINVGIAEQDMVGVAAGLANAGYIPFVCAAGPFLSGRATEQVKVDVAYSRYHIVLCAMSPGMAYGELGPTHHSIEDLSWMRAISGLSVIVPADPEQTVAAVKWAAAAGLPVYMRVPRTKIPSVTTGKGEAFAYGKANVVRDGRDVTVIATGTLVSRAVEAAERLAGEGRSVRVLNISTIAPLDEEAVVAAARETGAIVTAEEGMTEGGLGAAVASLVVRRHPVPMRILGVPGFAPTGSTEFLLDHFHLNADGIAAAVRDLRG